MALSGGGTRSAAYSIGVLKALHEAGLLERLDIVSTVSGGGFASGWYYLQKYSHSKEGYKPLDDSVIETLAKTKPIMDPWDIPIMALLHTILSPGYVIRAITPVLAGRSPNNILYEQGIAERFLPMEDVVHREILHKNTLAVPAQISMEQLGSFVTENKLPLFIFNASVLDELPYTGRTNNMFEFTPFHFGGDGVGYQCAGKAPCFEPTPVMKAKERVWIDAFPTVSRVVTTSAAALDFNTGLAAIEWLRSSFGMDLGTVVEVPGADDFPKAYMHLTDGGHTENLAALPLIRRLCEDITIVDGEYDPQYEFGSYRLLQEELAQWYRASMEVDGISVTKTTKAQSLFLGGTQQDIPPPVMFDARKPVMNGFVGDFPLEGAEEPAKLRITYLKMSLNRSALAQSAEQRSSGASSGCPTTPSGYYTERIAEVATKHSVFPQIPTYNQWFANDVFLALADLGYAHMKWNICNSKAAN